MLSRQSLQQGQRKCGRQKETRLPRQDVIRDASTSGGTETSQCDVLLACAATRSWSRRNDREGKYGCRDSAQEMTPQRLWLKRTEVQNTEGAERSIVAGGFDGTPPVLSRPGVQRPPATESITKSTTISLCPDKERRTGSELHPDALNQQAPQLWCMYRSYQRTEVPELAAFAADG